MEFVRYTRLDHENYIREVNVNKGASIDLWRYQIVFYTHPTYYLACYCYNTIHV